MRNLAIFLISLLAVDAVQAAERLNFFRVRQGYATGTAKKGIARVHSSVDRNGPLGMAEPIALYQVARLARAAGQTHFVVLKIDCGTMMISGLEANSMCDVKARIDAEGTAPNGTSLITVADAITTFEGNPSFYRPY